MNWKCIVSLAGWLAAAVMAQAGPAVPAGLEKKSAPPGPPSAWEQHFRSLRDRLRSWEDRWKQWERQWRSRPETPRGPYWLVPPWEPPEGTGGRVWEPPWRPPPPPQGRVWGSRTVNGWTVWIIPCGPHTGGAVTR
ncbi:hypothetical protein [Limisphaera sp. VF-2]|uniref:hypothetical protein n=1 Tax=Limisphaera sp. VF-2 TaxID=3400418 RepID=UPI00177596F9